MMKATNTLISFRIFFSAVVISLVHVSCAQFTYPVAKRIETVSDDYFGNSISDPYRWLEDTNSEETKNYIEEQQKLTNDYIETFPQINTIRDTLTGLWNHTHRGIPRKAGNRYFFFQNSGLQNQSVLYVKDSLSGKPRSLLDPNTLQSDGGVSIVALDVSPSTDGEILCYGLSHGGSEWVTLHFKNVTSGEEFPEVLIDTKLTGALWTPDSRGIIYGHYPHQDKEDGSESFLTQNQKLYYHKLGTNQSEDRLVAEFPDNPRLILGLSNHITTDGKYLILSPTEGAGANFLFYADIEDALKTEFKDTKFDIKPLSTKNDTSHLFLANRGSELYFLTNDNSSKHQIVSIDLKNFQDGHEPTDSDWKVVIPETNNTLDWAMVVNKNVVVLSYLEDVKSTLELRNLENGSLLKTIPLEIGSILEHSGKVDDSEFFYKFKSYLTAGEIYRFDFKTGSLEPELDSEAKINGFNASEFTTKQVFFSSKDGTRIPMYIIHKNDFVPKGNSPCWLRGHGGFTESFVPDFAVPFVYLVEHFGACVAIPNIRGGFEYGQKWHDEGRLHNKQNSFDDFSAAAEYLIKEKYTEPSKLIIDGQSNGGLLVAVSINQRPDLFAAAIAHNPYTDMLRFQYFTTAYVDCLEYGCSDNEDHFKTLVKYSPLHNVKFPENETVQYPSVLLIAGDKDDRIVPAHSYKFTAELQHKIGANAKQSKPILLKIERNTGHGGGKPTSVMIEEWAEIFSFVSKSLGY